MDCRVTPMSILLIFDVGFCTEGLHTHMGGNAMENKRKRPAQFPCVGVGGSVGYILFLSALHFTFKVNSQWGTLGHPSIWLATGQGIHPSFPRSIWRLYRAPEVVLHTLPHRWVPNPEPLWEVAFVSQSSCGETAFQGDRAFL